MKLHPEDLDVISFDTGAADDLVGSTGTRDPNDPTPATFCRICPADTDGCIA